MNNITSATEYYKDVLKQDNTHVEAIACIGSNHFYTDQPEIALRFYRLVTHTHIPLPLIPSFYSDYYGYASVILKNVDHVSGYTCLVWLR